MRTYHVAAMSMPIVYTSDGDHDPNGMLFCLQAHRPLLQWARERWEADDRLLPRLHHVRQRAQLVVDGLLRLELTLERLAHGPESDQELLAELIRQEHQAGYGEAEDRWSHGSRRRGGRPGAVRTNVLALVTDLRVALADLGDNDGLGAWHPTRTDSPTDELDAPAAEGAAGDPDAEARPRLVTLSREQRTAWRAHWQAQSARLDAAIAAWFERAEHQLGPALPSLVAASGLSESSVRRLLLNDHSPAASAGRQGYDRFNPLKPIPLVRPLVLRTHVGEPVRIEVENRLSGRRIAPHLQGDGLFWQPTLANDPTPGSPTGDHTQTSIGNGQRRVIGSRALHEGVWPLNDLADVRGSERGSNAHGLFGALIVEPAGVRWHDPETGDDLTDTEFGTAADLDIIRPDQPDDLAGYVDLYTDAAHAGGPRSHREFTIFFHDEPEIHSGLHTVGEHSVMPLSYRAEPMHNRVPHRLRRLVEHTSDHPAPGQVGVDRTAVTSLIGDELEEQFWTARTPDGRWLERIAGEEQHHSSWLFGEPVTPVLRAYRGDPCRVRLVHAGVKETHVFHLHVHQWRAVAADTAEPSTWGTDTAGTPVPKGSQLLDSITIGPQTGITIDPLYGSGSRQQAVGDIIWHCHLYPHFHHGMWGMWRSFDQLVTDETVYPDGSPCHPLKALPGTGFHEQETAGRPPERVGFPWFVDGEYPMKSPPPPAGRPEHRNGRRILLGLPDCSPTERAAMSPGCAHGEYPGTLFTDLDRLAAEWNTAAGLPAPRVLHYDLEVTSGRVEYNVDGWHDPRTHHYRLLRAEVRSLGADGQYHVHGTPVTFEAPPSGPSATNPEPLYPRANHGDIVELELHNALRSFPADDFDLGQPAVECGLHVHLVKFDPLSADGSATGWNYLSGASCQEAVGSDHPGQRRTVSLHRWVVDEELGPCFFHDHLLANYRQKHGLFGALIAEPHGSQWQLPHDPSEIAWGAPQAVIVPPESSGLPPYREACLAVGDFVPLLDRGGNPLNPPSTLSGDDDPGSMGVNYRSAPLTHRGKDPAQWFSTAARSTPNLLGFPGDPDTPVIEAYPSDRLRIRLIQGSHEEQHTFAVNGMRWRRDWGHPGSTLVNQQTLGISEAFSFDIDPVADSPFGPGDHLWSFPAIDDLWTGCWGYVRVLRPTVANLKRLPALPSPNGDPAEKLAAMRAGRATPTRPRPRPDGQPGNGVRTFVVVARRTEHRYAGKHLTDPWGLVLRTATYRAADHRRARTTGIWSPHQVAATDAPLVLRAHRGEWVRLFLVNEVLHERDSDDPRRPRFGVEPSPPRLPLEHLDDRGLPDRRTVSPRVSLHPSLLRFDVSGHDGSHVGRNQNSTVPPLKVGRVGHGDHDGPGDVVMGTDHHGDQPNWIEYWWYADDLLAPASHADGPGTVCLLSDLADVRNHRHHGLFGALVVEPADVRPFAPGSTSTEPDGYTGVDAELRSADGAVVAREGVVFVQDGLRLFTNGHPDLPVPDVVPGDDPEDSGQKAINYRTGQTVGGRPPRGSESAQILRAEAGDTMWLRLVGAGDKPRQHTLTVHGCAWPAAAWKPDGQWVGSVSGVAPGWSETIVVTAQAAGEQAVRTGCFRWGTELGVWSHLDVDAR